MELVYLWIKKYKNIEKQEFNFSPKFQCKYDEDSNELTIDENDDYIPDFFGENINVTAIVGKNGSGKSSVLKAITDNTINNKIIKIYYNREADTFYKFARENNNIRFYINGHETDINEINYQDENYKTIFFEKFYRIYDISWGDSIVNVFDNNAKDIQLIIDFSKNKDFSLPFLRPEELTLTFVDHNFYAIVSEKIQRHKYSIDFIANNFFNIDKKVKNNQLKIIKFNLIIASLLSSQGDLNNKLSAAFYSNNNPASIDDIIEMFKNGIDKTVMIQIEYIINEMSNNFTSDKYFTEFKVKLNKLSKNFIKYYRNITHSNNGYILEDKDVFNFKISPYPSEGEYQFLLLFSKMYKYMDKRNITLLIDEGENHLHPNWQKSFINYIRIFLNSNYSNSKIQLIFATHSPFLLSDIPKQNIIFLDKDENGNCKVVDGLKEKKQTFGANIHTLLSDSFFMKDGLMGEFAKDKIDKAIKYLNQEKLSDKELKYCEQIISIIGEPIVKNQLQRMLDSKKINYLAKDTREEIEFLKHRIDLLSKRL